MNKVVTYYTYPPTRISNSGYAVDCFDLDTGTVFEEYTYVSESNELEDTLSSYAEQTAIDIAQDNDVPTHKIWFDDDTRTEHIEDMEYFERRLDEL